MVKVARHLDRRKNLGKICKNIEKILISDQFFEAWGKLSKNEKK